MRVLVTGGCGFVGSHLVNRLIDEKCEVIILDNLSADNNKFHFNKDANADYVNIDIRDEGITKYFDGVDHVFHLAAEARIQASIENPKNAVSINAVGTASVLQACVDNRVKRITYSSTSAIYGLTEKFPTDEDTPIDCLNPYAASKFAGEELVRCYTKMYDLDASILRYFNVYGENSPVTGPYSLVIGIFLSQKQRGLPLTVVGKGDSLRDFVHVSDVVGINMSTLYYPHRLDGEVFNVGSGVNISVLDVAKIISDKIEFVPFRLGEAKTTLADISKAKEILHWTPKIRLPEWLVSQAVALDFLSGI